MKKKIPVYPFASLDGSFNYTPESTTEEIISSEPEKEWATTSKWPTTTKKKKNKKYKFKKGRKIKKRKKEDLTDQKKKFSLDFDLKLQFFVIIGMLLITAIIPKGGLLAMIIGFTWFFLAIIAVWIPFEIMHQITNNFFVKTVAIVGGIISYYILLSSIHYFLGVDFTGGGCGPKDWPPC